MAGNNSIQILRGTNDKVINSQETLLPGQPFYNITKGYLTIGGEENTSIKSAPIKVREVVAYVGDAPNLIMGGSNDIYYKVGTNTTTQDFEVNAARTRLRLVTNGSFSVNTASGINLVNFNESAKGFYNLTFFENATSNCVATRIPGPLFLTKGAFYLGDSTVDPALSADANGNLDIKTESASSNLNIISSGGMNIQSTASMKINTASTLTLTAATTTISDPPGRNKLVVTPTNINMSSNGTSYIAVANTNVNIFSTGNINATTGFFNVAATSGVNITSGAGQVRINAYSINMQTNALGSVNISTSMLNLNANNGFEIYSSSSVAGSRISSGSMSITGSSTININSPNLLLYGGYGGIGGLELRTTNPTSTVKVNMAGNIVSFPWKSGTVALTNDIPVAKEYCKVLYNGNSVTSYTIRNSTDWGMILCLVQYDSRGVYGVPVMFDPQVAAQAQACIPAIRASDNTIYWGNFKTVKSGNNTTISGNYIYQKLDGSSQSTGSVYIKQVIGFCPV